MMAPDSTPVSPRRLMDLSSAFYGSCVLFAASDLEVFAFLDRVGGASVDAVARECRLDPRAAALLLNACVALDLLTLTDDRYANTPEVATFLVAGKAGDLSRAIRYNRDVYPAWGRLDALIRTGRPVESPSLHLGDDPSRTRQFVDAMHARALAIGRAVIPALALSHCRQLLDVGGGSGAYSILAAQTNPVLRVTLMDLPAVAAIAAENVRDAGLADRIECRPGNYRATPFPRENDAVLLFGMLHQETAEAIRALLRKAHEALHPGGRVYVLDMMTDASRCHPAFSALFALNMALTAENGWVFSDADLREWLGEAGFEAIECRPLPPPMPHWLAVARRAN